MGSKKLKRKKKHKIEKFHKLRTIKRMKKSAVRINGEKTSEKSLNSKNVSENRSREENSFVPEVKWFSKIREDYFRYLQRVISDNCVFYNSVVTEEMLNNLALELEQNALLACLQIDIYKKSMCKIIRDIKKSTEEKQVHIEVRKLLPESVQEKQVHTEAKKILPDSIPEKQVHAEVKKLLPDSVPEKGVHAEVEKILPDCIPEKQVNVDIEKHLPDSIPEKTNNADEKSAVKCSEPELYSRIPTIASIRKENSVSNSYFWTQEPGYNADLCYQMQNHDIHKGNQNVSTASQLWLENGSHLSGVEPYCNIETTKTNGKDLNTNNTTEVQCDSHSSNVSGSFNNSKEKDQQPKNVLENAQKCKKLDPLLASRSHLQKLVEKTLIETEKIQKEKRVEQEKAYIAQILEGDDSIEYSLSDNDVELKENVSEGNLMIRLEKMKEIFGLVEEEEEKKKEKGKDVEDKNENENEAEKVKVKENPANSVPPKPKQIYKNLIVNYCNPGPNFWKHEKFIQLHKYSLIAGEMTVERRSVNSELFHELFGEDSDEEHEGEYLSEEKYRSSCVERISSWVVKYLKPFYHNKRILGRTVFRTLGHHISSTIVDSIQYPDEWTVKYFVSKFFPSKMKYTCDEDVLNFQLD